MDHDSIGTYRSKQGKPIPKHSHFRVIAKSKPEYGVDKGGKDDDDMTNPPEELLMLDDNMETLLKGLDSRVS